MELPLNQIIQGDCFDVLQTFPDKSIDLILTDPPYGIGIAKNPFRQKFKKENWDDTCPSERVFAEMFRVSRAQVIWGGNYFGLPASQCFYVWDKVQPQNFSSSMCELAWVSRQSPAKIWRERVVGIEKFHPTTKPTDLMRWCLTFFPDAKIICDPFAGSGTIAVAAKMEGRNYIGIGISEKYCDIARSRIAASPVPLFLDQRLAA